MVSLKPFVDALVGLSPAFGAFCLEGLPAAIDVVAAHAAASHRFLRQAWFDAAVKAYGGTARTIVATRGEDPVAALPTVRVGPAWARLAAVPGCYWPFRSFPVAQGAGPEEAGALLGCLGRHVRAVRIGPVYDDDPALEWLLPAARARGWAVVDRFVADSYALDMGAMRAQGQWPRNSTLRKNRFHEKHLAGHGSLDWTFAFGKDWNEQAFAALAQVEQKSWIAARTDGSDAKFTAQGHGAFWRAAARDPVLSDMMWAAMLHVDGQPAAFSFDLNVGPLKYAIANSYDPAFAKHSPGKLLYYRNLVRAIEDGMSLVDWGAGDSGYKSTIGAQKGPAIRDWLLVRPGPWAVAARMLGGLWRRSGQRGGVSRQAAGDAAPDAARDGERPATLAPDLPG